MNVYGYTVKPDVLKAMIARMQSAPFRKHELECLAIRMGVPEKFSVTQHPADRCADRLIQWHRKRGDIKPVRRESTAIWEWISK